MNSPGTVSPRPDRERGDTVPVERDEGELALPRPPGLFRRWMDRHPRTVDLLIALVTAGLPAVIVLVVMAVSPSWDMALGALGAAALFVCTLFRRRVPFLLLAVAIPVGMLSTSGQVLGTTSAWVALYSLAVYVTVRQVWLGFGITATAWFVRTLVTDPDRVFTDFDAGDLRSWLILVSALAQSSIAFLLPTFIGLWVGGRRRYERALIERAEDLARERDQRARLAVSEERTRIAREMHDIISHSLTVMITLSEGAAAQAEKGSDRAPAAMRRVADTGRDSLAEMRRLLGVLRTPDAPVDLAPQPESASIAALVQQFREAGMPVTWRSEGVPLPPGGVSLTAYRIVQESLTNVLRHAPDTRRVSVSVVNTEDRVTLTIDNESTHDPLPSDGTGRGLVGMRERATLHGGSVEAGLRPDGCWRVRATLYLEETP